MKNQKQQGQQGRKGASQGQGGSQGASRQEPAERKGRGSAEEEEARSAAPDPYDAGSQEDIEPGERSRELADEGDED
jgi:hypothetical protein